MKISNMTLGLVLIAIIASFGAYQQGKLIAESEIAPAKIAVVNVTKVIKNCQKFKQWQETKEKERLQIQSELNTMQTELESLSENLKIRTPGSEDHRKLVKEFIEKKAAFQSKETVYKEVWENEKERWTEEIYQKLLAVIDTVAVLKGLDIVLANEEINLSDPLRPDIMQTIVTKKLVYHNSKYDITDEVLTAMDAAQ